MIKRYAVYSREEYNDLLEKLEKEGYSINGFDSLWEEDFYGKRGILTIEIYKDTKIINIHTGTSSHDPYWKCGMKLFDSDLKEEDGDNNYLTTDEFIKAVEELGYETEDVAVGKGIGIKTKGLLHPRNLAVVEMETPYTASLRLLDYTVMDDSQKKEIWDLVIKFASTPVEKRAKKYNLKLTGAFDKCGKNYLNCDAEDGSLFFGTNCVEYKTTFTKAKAEELKQRVIDSLEIVEVE